MSVRLNINISEDTAGVLKELAARNDISVTEVVRRAIAVYRFIDDEVVVKKRKMQLVDEDTNKVAEVAFVA